MTGLANGTAYTFEVRAVNAEGEGLASNRASAVPLVLPGAPTDLAASAGPGAAVLRWTAPASDGGSAITGYRYRQSDDDGDNWSPDWTDVEGSGATTTAFTVAGLANGTAYTFEVRAVNAEGAGAASNRASVTPFGPPGAPTGLAATAGHGYAVLAWAAPDSDGGSPLTGFQYRQSDDGGDNWEPDWADIAGSTTIALSTTSTPLTVTGLDNSTTYTFEVRAVNAAGAGAASNQASATPVAGTGARMRLSVVTCQLYGRRGCIHHDRIAEDAGTVAVPVQIDIPQHWETSTYWASVNNKATGQLDIRVETLGTGEHADATATEGVDYEGVSQDFAVTEPDFGTSKSVVLSIDVPVIHDRVGESDEWFLIRVTVLPSTTFAFRGETPRLDSLTLAHASQYLTVKHVDNAPGAPEGLVAWPGDEEAVLRWTGGPDGGSDLTGYQYRQSDDDGDNWSPDWADIEGSGAGTTSHAVGGLDNGTAYTFEVRAVNAEGEGLASNRASAVPLALPGAPTDLAASAGPGAAVLRWTAPASDGGSAITGYRYRQSTDGGRNWRPDWTDIADSAPGGDRAAGYPVEGLVSGPEYGFEVRAVNAEGAGPPSNRARVTLPVTPVSAPGREVWSATLTVAGNGLDRHGYFHQDRMGIPGGALSDRRFAYNGLHHGVGVTSVPGGGDRDVEIGTLEFILDQPLAASVANNANLSLHVGAREFRFDEVLSTPPVYSWRDHVPSRVPSWIVGQTVALSLRDHAPSAPGGLAVEPGDGEVGLAWTVPASDGGSDVTGFQYRQSDDGGDDWSPDWTDTGSATTTAITVAGLDNGTAYTFEVRAVNERSAGAASNRASATPFGLPGAPTGLAASPGHGYAVLAWAAPDSDGGSPLTGFQYRQSDDGGDNWEPDWADIAGSTTIILSATSTPLTVDGLDNGTTYTFEVRAVNAAGEGAASNQASANLVAGTGARMILAVRTCRTYGRPSCIVHNRIAEDAGTVTVPVQIDIPQSWAASGYWAHPVDKAAGQLDLRVETLGAGEHADATATEGVDYEGVSQDFAVTEPDFGTDTSAIVSIDVPVIHDRVGESDEWFLIRVTMLPSTTFAFRGETPRLDSLTLAHASQYLTVKHVDNAPGAPEGLVAWPGDEEAVLRWTAGPDGGSAITGYQYRRSDDDGDNWSPDWTDIEGSGAGTTSHAVGGLDNGTAYTFEVRAVNAEGEGLASNRARAVPLVVALAFEAAEADTAEGAGTVTVCMALDAPAARDAMVRFRTVGDTARDGSDYGGRDLVLTIAAGDARICQSIAIVDDAEGEAEEYFEVVLSELSGGIELGDPSTVRVRIADDDGTIPAAPAELSATPGNGEVTLRWTTPASDGGRPITTFRYRQSTDGGDNWSPDWTAIPDCTPDTVEHTVGGLTNGTYYTFEVQAVNMLGRGPPLQPRERRAVGGAADRRLRLPVPSRRRPGVHRSGEHRRGHRHGHRSGPVRVSRGVDRRRPVGRPRRGERPARRPGGDAGGGGARRRDGHRGGGLHRGLAGLRGPAPVPGHVPVVRALDRGSDPARRAGGSGRAVLHPGDVPADLDVHLPGPVAGAFDGDPDRAAARHPAGGHRPVRPAGPRGASGHRGGDAALEGAGRRRRGRDHRVPVPAERRRGGPLEPGLDRHRGQRPGRGPRGRLPGGGARQRHGVHLRGAGGERGGGGARLEPGERDPEGAARRPGEPRRAGGRRPGGARLDGAGLGRRERDHRLPGAAQGGERRVRGLDRGGQRDHHRPRGDRARQRDAVHLRGAGGERGGCGRGLEPGERDPGGGDRAADGLPRQGLPVRGRAAVHPS